MKNKIITFILFAIISTQIVAQDEVVEMRKTSAADFATVRFMLHVTDYIFNTSIINDFKDKFYNKYPYEYSNSFSSTIFHLIKETSEPISRDHLFQVDMKMGTEKDYKNISLGFKLNYQKWAFKSNLRSIINDINLNFLSLNAERKTYTSEFWDSGFAVGYNSIFIDSERKDNLSFYFNLEIFPIIPFSLSANVEAIIGQQNGLIQSYAINLHLYQLYIGASYDRINLYNLLDREFLGIKFGYYY